VLSAEYLIDELPRVRERGYSIDNEECKPGVRCIGAPMFDRDGNAITAISVGAPTGRPPANLEGCPVATHVVAAAQAISRELGYVRPSPARLTSEGAMPR
jgi:DNA-binding IclR family transcriptional regulator